MIDNAHDLLRLLRRSRRALADCGDAELLADLDDAVRQLAPVARYDFAPPEFEPEPAAVFGMCGSRARRAA